MRVLVETLTRPTEIEYCFTPVKDEFGQFIDTGKTTQTGPDSEDKEPLFKHKGRVNQISVFVQERPDVYRRVTFSSYEITQIYLKMIEIEKQESEEPIGDW